MTERIPALRVRTYPVHDWSEVLRMLVPFSAAGADTSLFERAGSIRTLQSGRSQTRRAQ